MGEWSLKLKPETVLFRLLDFCETKLGQDGEIRKRDDVVLLSLKLGLAREVVCKNHEIRVQSR